MDVSRDLEEKLREAACFGNDEAVKQLVDHQGVSVNARNEMNGWTPLHWAAKRGHSGIASFLLEHGADASAKTEKGETPADVATSDRTRAVLGLGPASEGDGPNTTDKLPIIPSYLSNPPFPYVNSGVSQTSSHSAPAHNPFMQTKTVKADENELVLKVRVANSAERDFIEVELSQNNLTFETLISTMCSELDVNRALVHKIRKLPNTIVRKDKDVGRLVDFQELELVLTNRAVSESSRNYNGGPSVMPKHVDVVY